MKCPKCNEEIIDGIKFCTKCGVNIEEEKKRIADEEAKKQEEAEKKRKAAEDKKRLEEIRKQEELKKEQEIKEAEKQAAIRQAKEEGIELEIIDEAPEIEANNTNNTSDFKIKKQETIKGKPEKKKKQKVKIKKNIFQRILNKIIFMIVVAAIIIGGVYYFYTQEMLPDFAQKEVKEFESKLKNVIKLYKEVKDEEKEISEKKASEENWYIEPTIEATDIKDLTKEVSVIVKGDKQGIIDNNTGKIIIEPTYEQILYAEYYDLDKTENEKETGIVVKEGENFFKLDKEYKKQEEVRTIAEKDEGTYFYEHHRNNIYYNSAEQKCTKIKEDPTKTGLKVCTDIDLVTTDGIAATSIDMPENFSIDFSKSKITTKGYFDLSTGKLKINCDYDEAYEFSEGYAVIEKEITSSDTSTSEVYDSEGNLIAPLYKQPTLAGIIDENGKEVIEAKYEKIRSVHNRKAFAMKNGKWGVLEIK